jgi:hypothetical protein
MRTTVDIPDAVYRELKAKAAHEGATIKHLILKGVDTVLHEGDRRPRRRLKVPIMNMGKPGSLKLDNEKIYDLIGFP